MSKSSVGLLAAMILLCGVASPAQAMPGQAGDDSAQNAVAAYSKWVAVMVEFTRGVEVKEQDVRNYLEHWAELEELDLGDIDDENPDAFRKAINAALSDSQYRDWASARGLDPERFLRASMRLSSLYLLEQSKLGRDEVSKQWTDQEAMIEERCAQVDPEVCDTMRAGLAASKAMQQAMAKANQQLRSPTSGEQALLDQYSAEIDAAMEAEDEGDEMFEGEMYEGMDESGEGEETFDEEDTP